MVVPGPTVRTEVGGLLPVAQEDMGTMSDSFQVPSRYCCWQDQGQTVCSEIYKGQGCFWVCRQDHCQ